MLFISLFPCFKQIREGISLFIVDNVFNHFRTETAQLSALPDWIGFSIFVQHTLLIVAYQLGVASITRMHFHKKMWSMIAC